MSRIQHIDEKIQIDCGKYKAESCDACPQGHRDNWCSGDCVLQDQKCVLKMESK